MRKRFVHALEAFVLALFLALTGCAEIEDAFEKGGGGGGGGGGGPAYHRLRGLFESNRNVSFEALESGQLDTLRSQDTLWYGFCATHDRIAREVPAMMAMVPSIKVSADAAAARAENETEFPASVVRLYVRRPPFLIVDDFKTAQKRIAAERKDYELLVQDANKNFRTESTEGETAISRTRLKEWEDYLKENRDSHEGVFEWTDRLNANSWSLERFIGTARLQPPRGASRFRFEAKYLSAAGQAFPVIRKCWEREEDGSCDRDLGAYCAFFDPLTLKDGKIEENLELRDAVKKLLQ